MRLWAFFLFFSFQSIACLAQYSNDWVSYNQTYYKISVAATGIYRLTYDQLQQAGIPVNTIDPRLIQVYHRGVQQAIYFKHDQLPADSKFDNGEYLEFYGQRNDGTLDTRLYEPAASQPHKYYNLYSDTAAYFLTVNPLPVQGKRMEVFDQANSTSIPKETSHNAERLTLYTSEYAVGEVVSNFTTQSYFDEGEGWTGATICTLNSGCAGNEQKDFPIDQVVDIKTAQPPPVLEIQLTGRDQLSHQAEIYVGVNAGALRLLSTKSFDNFKTPVYTENLNWSDVGADGKVVVRVKGLGVGGIRERLSVAYIKLNFAQGFNLAAATTRTFNLNIKTGDSKSYVEIENSTAGTRLWDITDPSAIVQIGTRTSGSLLTAVVPNTNTARKLYSASTFLTPDLPKIKAITFQEINPQSNFVIISHTSLMQPALDYSNPVEAYAAYRASGPGGSYITATIAIDQVYDQFNYGETSPLAVRELMRYLIGEGDPQYLFLIGKGREVHSGIHRRTPAATESKDLVPTGGSPGSDMVFTAGLKGEPFVPAVATGRLTATTPLQVAAYLNKVKETEATPFTELWRKKILHLSGGKSANELELFKGYMQGFAQIAEGNFLGGDVSMLGKHGTDDRELINIAKEINAGLSLVTFFGHSAVDLTDIDIGYVTEPVFGYNNPGRYPAFLVNGCNAGEYFNDGINFGENWMLASGKGARNFIANSSYGYEDALRVYTTYFYDVAFADSVYLGKGIGDVQREVASRVLETFGVTEKFTAQVQQMVLLGDPSLKLFAPTKPDYSISGESINVVASDARPIHALTDAMEVQILTTNLGRSTARPLKVKIVHTVDDVVTKYEKEYASVLNQDVLKFTILRGSGNFYGNNKIEVVIDPENDIEELDETNNKNQWTRFIQFNGTQNLQPPDFGIVNATTATVLFQDTDVLAGEKTYQVQLDTTLAFNSGFLQSKEITGKILMKSQFSLLDTDSTAYYWRSKPSDKPDDQWETTSFSFIQNGNTGWAQMAFDQLAENSFNSLVADNGNKKFHFPPTSVSIVVRSLGSGNTTPGVTGSFQVNDAEYYYSPQAFGCRNNTINLVAFDRSSVVPYMAVPFTFDNSFGRACGREPQLINSFVASETSTGNHDDLNQYVENVKQGDSVVLFTMGDPGFSSWSAGVKTKLGELGIRDTDIDALLPGEPVIILAKKGTAPGTAKIIRSDQPLPETLELQITDTLTGFVTSGSMRSVVIGPALRWNSVAPRFRIDDPSDVVGMDIFRVDRDGNESLIFNNQQSALEISSIDASVYPFLRLVYRTSDPLNLTAATLRSWIVDFEPAPDGLLLPAGSTEQITVNEGAPYTAKYDFVNISQVDFTDSLFSVFSVLNKNKLTKETTEFSIKGPAAGDTTHFSRTIQTKGKAGLNDLILVVNNSSVTEQYYQNNSLELPSHLNVIKDQINPVLDVTVDGRYVSNYDFVSSNPSIKVTLWDENPMIPLADTTSLNLLLSYPCDVQQCPARRIAFSRSDVKWSLADNSLVVEFTPKGLEGGEYVLYAEGRDASGNPAGPEPYQVSFVVEEEAGMIFYPVHPNPSSTGFYFEFAAAGATPPESMVLDILDRNGRQVGRFTEDDAPSLRVGINQLRWSGLDSQGHRLSDGLYFYLLTVKSGDFEFKNSGRIVIIR
ncbi:MAG TPA: C25 family cysteine peptidase [Cyclobacteriaceae bacterium]|nr:C25 family cysteine peptidase [Cyclobacteriaceae bacterium]